MVVDVAGREVGSPSFVIAAAITLVGTYRDVLGANEDLAEMVTRQLQLQLFRIEFDLDVRARFPDWDPVVTGAQTAGQCIQYVKEDGRVGRSSCIGFDVNSRGALPVSCPALVDPPSDFLPQQAAWDFRRDDGEVRRAGCDLEGYVGSPSLTALVIGAICLLQFVAISRALRPTKEILAGLDALARGDLSCRLPSFRLVELQRISEVFNRLAANLELTTREKTALAAKWSTIRSRSAGIWRASFMTNSLRISAP